MHSVSRILLFSDEEFCWGTLFKKDCISYVTEVKYLADKKEET